MEPFTLLTIIFIPLYTNVTLWLTYKLNISFQVFPYTILFLFQLYSPLLNLFFKYLYAFMLKKKIINSSVSRV